MALLLLLAASASAVELPRFNSGESTPSSLLNPRSFNPHRQYLEETHVEATTRKGPVLFPNDAPPPPRPPLIVTSRPLSESIARSELNPTPDLNNSIAEPTQIKQEFRLRPEFRLKPELFQPRFLAKVKDYKPFFLSTPAPNYGVYGEHSKYEDYEDHHTALPPIYKAIADHAKEKVLKLKYKKPVPVSHLDYQEKDPVYSQPYQHNDVRDDIDYDHNSNYAFSYTVKDHNTGDDFSHSQHSTGSATNGEYRVRLPDGRMQIVSYTADENGYKADVRYDEDKTAGNSIDYNHDYNRNVHDYSRNVHDYNRNGHDYNRNGHDYNRNGHDYDRNRHDYPVNKQNYYEKNDYAANSHNYQRDFVTKPPPVKEDYNQYSDSSKEYYNTDYSSEYDGKFDNYGPHKSKFNSFAPKSTLGTIVVPSSSVSTVKPSYAELKPLFVDKNIYSTQDYLQNVELNVPSTTPSSLNYNDPTEHVVIIGTTKSPNLYTNIRNVPLTATPEVTATPPLVTPQSYLVSTIASLKNGQVPILSGRFIDKINKYLTFT